MIATVGVHLPVYAMNSVGITFRCARSNEQTWCTRRRFYFRDQRDPEGEVISDKEVFSSKLQAWLIGSGTQFALQELSGICEKKLILPCKQGEVSSTARYVPMIFALLRFTVVIVRTTCLAHSMWGSDAAIAEKTERRCN